MSFAETVLLGAIAGLTIFIGLPLGRIERVNDRVRVALAMFSVGILAFIFMDVTSNGHEIVVGALNSFKHHHSGFMHLFGMFLLLAISFIAGTAGISVVERWLRTKVTAMPPIAGGESAASLTAPQAASFDADLAVARKRSLQMGMTIATAIGLHNFAEGLAIGVSARAGAIGLATMLIIGFGLHNATEGFGIVGPLGGVKPSWKWLGAAGLVGGGPTFLGAVAGYQVHSASLELAFYGLAGGAILYVIGEIWNGMRRYGFRTLGLNMLALGFIVGIATDLVVTYGGG